MQIHYFQRYHSKENVDTSNNHEAVVEVVKKEYFSENEVPLPLDRTKHIIRKCTESDLNLPE